MFTQDAGIISPVTLRWVVTTAYLAVLGLISIYGLHRYWLVWLYYRHRREKPTPMRTGAALPMVTVQLPMFNEALVAERVIDAACALDYPRQLLQIQVLDDSTDGSAGIARRRVAHWAGKGVDIQYIHRLERTGYKAGALAHGLKQARGELIAIFDADFVPQSEFLRQTVDYFTDPAIGMVQTRWGHINRTQSLLTRSQAIFLDGHFVIEHAARNRSGRWINFNGTAGLWRRTAIESAGGWQHDTLTEDVDLSYRAQLAGWRFLFLPDVVCPAELPPQISAFKSQQHRWTKGSVQTARKLLPRILRAPVPLSIKIEAFFHLTCPMVYAYMMVLMLLFFPAIYVNMQPFEKGSFAGLLLGLSLFAIGSVSASTFYIASQKAQGRGVWGTVLQLPMLMSIGLGIAVNNSRACLEALVGHESAFIRTPKFNAGGEPSSAAGDQGDLIETDDAPRRGRRPRMPTRLIVSLLELVLAGYLIQCVYLAVQLDNAFVSVPFLGLFAAGYLYVGLASLWQQLRSWRPPRPIAVPAS